MKYIVFDTNIILSASINVYYKRKHIQHEFNDESTELFELIKDYKKTVKGILLEKVYSECDSTLMSAVKDAYKKAGGDMSIFKEINHDDATNLGLQVIFKMIELIGLLELYTGSTDYENQYNKNLNKVKDMSKKLIQECKEQRQLAPDLVPDQLDKFVDNYPHDADEIILAQSITFKNSLYGKPCVFLASKDMKFFSPRGNSKTVTKRIYKKFGIQCDHPREIIKIIKNTA
ncbi:MAG: hypothetical protein OXC46_08325 [Thaumarchaeota archaeon]|nr:hypothetical protein [Nitrososphaerota archaeon]